jgi:hypothetical protein
MLPSSLQATQAAIKVVITIDDSEKIILTVVPNTKPEIKFLTSQDETNPTKTKIKII